MKPHEDYAELSPLPSPLSLLTLPPPPSSPPPLTPESPQPSTMSSRPPTTSPRPPTASPRPPTTSSRPPTPSPRPPTASPRPPISQRPPTLSSSSMSRPPTRATVDSSHTEYDMTASHPINFTYSIHPDHYAILSHQSSETDSSNPKSTNSSYQMQYRDLCQPRSRADSCSPVPPRPLTPQGHSRFSSSPKDHKRTASPRIPRTSGWMICASMQFQTSPPPKLSTVVNTSYSAKEEKSSSGGGGSKEGTSTPDSGATTPGEPAATAATPTAGSDRAPEAATHGYENRAFVEESPSRRRISPSPGSHAALEVPAASLVPDTPRRKSILHVSEYAYDGPRAAVEGPVRRVSILQTPQHPHGEDGESPSRKVSLMQQSPLDGAAPPHYEAHTDGPSRRKSILSQASHHSSHKDGTEAPSRKVSILHAPDYVTSPGSGTYSQHGDAESPMRRKSQIHGSDSDLASHHSYYSQPSHHSIENGKATGDGLAMRRFPGGETFAEKFKYHDPEKSWLFLFCAKCRQQPSGEAWEPPGWQRVCPHPFCPSYRQCARLLALLLIGLLAWGVVFCVVGHSAAPGGQLFGLAALALVAHLGGWLVSLTTLPPLIGMLLVGILMQNVGLVRIADDYRPVVATLRRIALVIILTRAGLDLDPAAMNRLRVAVLKLSLVPWVVECAAVAVSAHLLLGLPWMWGVLLGSVVAAVSPAVVVSCLIRLRAKGYGVAKGIPTLIIAISGIDDAISVAGFGIIQSVMFSTESLAYQIAQGPLSILGGLAFGGLWGLLAKFVPEKNDPFAVPLRILLLFGGGLIAVFGSEEAGFGGAGPLGVVAAAFVACYHWSQQGWEVEDNPVATAFEVFWMIFEPILFSLTGTQIRFNELAGDTVSVAFACLIIGIVIRIVVTVIVAIGCKLNLKEKIFVALAWMSKATVQAALGPVALDLVRPEENQHPEKKDFAEKTLVVCVLSILLTAPVGAILMTILGPRLLKKTSMPPVVEGWRRSARPSLRDITIIDEEEDGDGIPT